MRGLPLALQIVAALLAENPGKPLAAMIADLADQASRLAELSYGSVALTTVFDLSYEQLPAGQARLFRLLSVNPGLDIATTAAAALAGLPQAETRRGLAALARAHLIEPAAARVSHDYAELLQSPVARQDESTMAIVDSVFKTRFECPADSSRTAGGTP